MVLTISIGILAALLVAILVMIGFLVWRLKNQLFTLDRGVPLVIDLFMLLSQIVVGGLAAFGTWTAIQSLNLQVETLNYHRIAHFEYVSWKATARLADGYLGDLTLTARRNKETQPLQCFQVTITPLFLDKEARIVDDALANDQPRLELDCSEVVELDPGPNPDVDQYRIGELASALQHKYEGTRFASRFDSRDAYELVYVEVRVEYWFSEVTPGPRIGLDGRLRVEGVLDGQANTQLKVVPKERDK